MDNAYIQAELQKYSAPSISSDCLEKDYAVRICRELIARRAWPNVIVAGWTRRQLSIYKLMAVRCNCHTSMCMYSSDNTPPYKYSISIVRLNQSYYAEWKKYDWFEKRAAAAWQQLFLIEQAALQNFLNELYLN